MIKLTPEHVGTRVLLSDGEIALLGDYDVDCDAYHVNGNGFWFFCPSDGVVYDLEHDTPSVILLLDAPNPLDVPVPDWCERIVGWHDDEGPTEIVPASRHRHWSKYPPDLRNLIKWSPAPGQMPPKNNEDIK